VASDARAIVVGSTDGKSFSAGADLDLNPDQRERLSGRLYDLYERMLTLPAPIVAAIPGAAVGGGAQIALACDMRIASPAALFRFPGPANGITAGAWGLPSLVGRGRAFDLAATMRDVRGEEALAIGLVDRLADDPLAAAIEVAGALAAMPQGVAANTKRLVAEGAGLVAAVWAERAANAGRLAARDR
jgi:enoyl-CoA hydratase/carnithine racemase